MVVCTCTTIHGQHAGPHLVFVIPDDYCPTHGRKADPDAWAEIDRDEVEYAHHSRCRCHECVQRNHEEMRRI